MKTKLFTLLLTVAASVGTMFAWDYERVQIGDLYYNLDATNQTAGVTSSSDKYSGDIIIPSSVTYNEITYSVTSIGDEAFYYCSGLTSIEIPNSVTSIGADAFHGCSGLTSVTIGNSVTSIGDAAFAYSGLTSITIPNSVTSIGWYAFRDCTGLTSVTIPNSVTSIGDCAFGFCTGLTSPVYNAHVFAYMPTSYSGAYTIPDGIESIAGGAFDKCTGLTSVTISNSVTSIGDEAFYYCSGLTSIEIPNSVTSIGADAFHGCSGLTSVTIPNSVTSIGEFAFYNCSSLPIIDNIHYADTYLAAVADKTLSSYSVKDGTKWIGTRAFSDCTSLTSVTIPNSVTSLGEQAFSGCTGLTSFEIPNSITRIGGAAFGICDNLATITIPNSVTSIGDLAFDACTGLTSITCEAVTPPTLEYEVFYSVNKSIPLYVPAGSVDAYKAAEGWKDFKNILLIGGSVDTKETNVNVKYVDNNEAELHAEKISFNVPVAPVIEGFTFVKWEVTGDLEDGIIIRAIYKADEPSSAPAVYTNPANSAQKLIRNGNVYILTEDKIYTITGQEVIVP